MAGTIIDMSKIKQLLHLKKAGVSNRQIAKDLKMSRDKANEYVNRAESDPLGIDGLLQLDDPVLEKRFHPGNPAYTDERMETFLKLLPDFVEQLSHKHVTGSSYGKITSVCIRTVTRSPNSTFIWHRILRRRRSLHLRCHMTLGRNSSLTLPATRSDT